MFMYSGMCIQIFTGSTIYVCSNTRIQICTYKHNVFMLRVGCGTSQRFGIGPSDYVFLVPPCESLVSWVLSYMHHWNQHGCGRVFECGSVFCKLGCEILPIFYEFVGNVQKFVQHCT